MDVKRALLPVTLVTFLWAAPLQAANREIRLKVTYSGSSLSIFTDANHGGITTGLGTVAGKSNLGRCTSQGVGEAAVTGSATCPNGNRGIELTLVPGSGHSLMRFENTGDMLFSELTSETVCYDPSTKVQFKAGTENVTGGTGRFVGATGQLQFQGTQWPLFIDPNANGFAAQEGTVSGTITLRRP